ncbi:DUF6907 domain-containing protein [Streptomyces sp. NPDC050564]|uniref:DUF6907 domain-containing protein n=1 Tax=Streptomyces sp. NPDC050564 TaxID=3365631 RepID=UPI00379E5024
MTTTVQSPATPEPADQAAPLTDKHIVPALVDGQYVFLECPTWCVIDHVRENQKFLADVWHSGPFADLEAPRRADTPLLFAYARLGIDPFSSDDEMRRPFLFVEDGVSAEGSYMDAEHAEQFADNLVAFAEKIRTMGRALKAEVA